METTIRINTDMLTLDILEGIKKMFPHKKVEITIQEQYVEEFTKEGSNYIEGDEDASQFILNRPAYAAELLRRIKSYEENKEDVINVKVEDLIK